MPPPEQLGRWILILAVVAVVIQMIVSFTR